MVWFDSAWRQLYHPRRAYPSPKQQFSMPREVSKFVWLICLGMLLIGCERPAPPTTQPGKAPRIASLVPAATDLLVGMGAGDHLVAVSNWDAPRPEIAHFPRVGDYQTIDWEKLAQLRPDVMIVFMSIDRIPAGIRQRAADLNIELINVKPDTLDEIFQTIETLGRASGESAKADAFARSLRSRLDEVARRVAGKPKVRTLIARDEDGFALVGGDTFVDALLTIAGGTNVAGNFPTRYPTVDRERVLELAPEAVIQLMPGASEPVVERARRLWRSLPDVPAVKDGRIHILTDWYVLQPGSHIADLAEQMAERLHPQGR